MHNEQCHWLQIKLSHFQYAIYRAMASAAKSWQPSKPLGWDGELTNNGKCLMLVICVYTEREDIFICETLFIPVRANAKSPCKNKVICIMSNVIGYKLSMGHFQCTIHRAIASAAKAWQPSKPHGVRWGTDKQWKMLNAFNMCKCRERLRGYIFVKLYLYLF